MSPHFFIDRPVFAAVLSIVIVIAGLLAALNLPIAEYPDIAPPTIQVTCNYPGASAKVLAETVAAPIEQQVNGVENMLYMTSTCGNDGSYALTVTFQIGTNVDVAQVLVQNRVTLATPQLPTEVQRTGVTTRKRSPDILLVVNLISPNGKYDRLYLSNYATIQVRDELARVSGVGDVIIFGQQAYSMRIWLNPEKLLARQLTTQDVVAAVREQNVQVAAGQIGAPPIAPGQVFEYTLRTLGRLETSAQFGDIIIKTGADGEITRLRDVARIELGAQTLSQTSQLDGAPSVGIAAFQLPGANALETADRINAKMEELKRRFPEGLDYAIVYDTTPFIRQSVHDVFDALRDAFILVGIVVLVFLQNWRTTLIPMTAVPVALLGACAVLYVFGFGLNAITLFGLVLAVGIVVDDAIVVVENVERWMEEGLPAREAAHKAMSEVTAAVIAIAFGLSAIFIPTAFLPGIPGQFFRPFAITIASATLISAVNSLTLSPALAALLLRPHSAKKDWFSRLLGVLLGWFFTGFNRTFDKSRDLYAGAVRWCVRLWPVSLLFYAGLLVATYYGFKYVPMGFVPVQDKGYLLVNVQLPDSASMERTEAVMAQADQIARSIDGIEHTVGISGNSILLGAAGSNYGSMFVILGPFEGRHSPELGAGAIQKKLQGALYTKIDEAQVSVFEAPAVRGLGNAGGLKFMLEDRGNVGLNTLEGQAEMLVERGRQTPNVGQLFTQFRAETPQLYVDVDRTRCKMLGLSLDDVFNTLQVNFGGFYVNDFNRFGRTWQVKMQAAAPFRESADQIRLLNVRNDRGEMIPLGSVATIVDATGPALITRHNLYPAAPIYVVPPPGVSSNQTISAIEGLGDRELGRGLAIEWTEIAYLEKLSGALAILIFPLCVLFVFLTHSAEYESFSLPLGIIMIVPMSLLCALVGVQMAGMDNNLFVQIGFVVLAGLAVKNAVLIIEFAKQQRDEHGRNALDAAVEASRLRLRPILMTSFAFILGVVPLAVAKGAGAELRQALGISVFAGMLGVTIFGVFLTPVFYYVLERITEWLLPKRTHATGE